MESFLGEYKYSQILEEFPDKEKYPLYYEASKHEFTINAGEMLFIPAGWYHFVFSEDVDPKTSLNFAVNYWYKPVNNWRPGQSSGLLPRVEKHSLNLNYRHVFGNDKIRCTRSEIPGLFPSNRVFHKFKGKISDEFMTFDEFYETKNPKYYIIQGENNQLRKYAPKYETELLVSSAWVNFGNSRSLIHFDEYDNWLCQIGGKKRVLLFPHEDRNNLYMFNPTDVNVILNIVSMKETPIFFISKTDFKQEDDPKEVYKQKIMEYDNRLREGGNTLVPRFENPTKFILHDTNGQGYSESQNYPLNVFMVTEGAGSISFFGRTKIFLDKGSMVIFPNHFTFPWCIEGNLKIIKPL